MALNDKFQLTNYGSEVQKAIDDALIHIPQDLALKAYRDEVLTKTQTIPYTPTSDYHPATKLYVDTSDEATNIKLDAEIARATAAENVLNIKPVLLYDDSLEAYKYINLVDLDRGISALVDEKAMDKRIAELNTGFFIYMLVDSTTGDIIDGRLTEVGINPYIVVKAEDDLPISDEVPNEAIALTLNDTTTINVYKYVLDDGAWELLNSPEATNGWIFASVHDDHGYYWFVNTWNLIDMDVDMSQYYTKTEADTILTNYVEKLTLGDPNTLTTTDKATIVGAINETNALTKTKDTLPEIANNYLLANKSGGVAKPMDSVRFSSGIVNSTIPQRTSVGTLKAATAIDDDDLTPLAQVKSLIENQDLSIYQTKIPAGTANNIIAYSGTAGTLSTLNRLSTINATAGNRTDMNIPTEKAVGTYVDNYKPMIVTQGSTSTSVTTNQLTFWIES